MSSLPTPSRVRSASGCAPWGGPVCGHGGAGAHAAVEYGDLASVAHCAPALPGTARSFCA